MPAELSETTAIQSYLKAARQLGVITEPLDAPSTELSAEDYRNALELYLGWVRFRKTVEWANDNPGKHLLG